MEVRLHGTVAEALGGLGRVCVWLYHKTPYLNDKLRTASVYLVCGDSLVKSNSSLLALGGRKLGLFAVVRCSVLAEKKKARTGVRKHFG